ncbi:MAG: DUF2092 domain-containing protein [Planctomycetota bacterium]
MRTFKRAPFGLSCAMLAVFSVVGGETKPAEVQLLDGKGIAILRSAIDYLASTTKYSMTLHNTTTFDGGPGKFKESTGKYEVSVERPNKMAMVIKDGDLRCAVISDGKTLCTYAPPLKVFAQRDAPKTLVELFNIEEIKSVVQEDLSELLFLDNLSMNNAFDIIMDGVMNLSIRGVEKVEGGASAYRLHFKEKDLEWDMWIEVGTQPLLRKIAIVRERTVKDDKGPVKIKKTIVSKFDDWKVNLEIPADRFVFVPPKDVKRVPSFLEQPGDAGKAYDPKLLGETAPQFVAKLLSGGTLDLSEHKGKNVVLLDFWATWCGPCRKAQPIVSEVCAGFAGKGLAAYAVNLKETPEKVKEFQTATPSLTLPIVLDEEAKIAEAYRVQPIPMTVVIGKNGIVEAVYLGLPNDLEGFKKNLKAQISTLLEGGTLLKK